MSATTGSTAPAAPSLASSAAFRAFAVVFAIAAPILYVLCDLNNWPLVTYHPAVGKLDLGFVAARKDEGPAMYWYGWTATTLLGAGILGVIAAFLPQRLTRRIPLTLVWLTPLLVIPILLYSLRFFWR
jgi:hypothetical protein